MEDAVTVAYPLSSQNETVLSIREVGKSYTKDAHSHKSVQTSFLIQHTPSNPFPYLKFIALNIKHEKNMKGCQSSHHFGPDPLLNLCISPSFVEMPE